MALELSAEDRSKLAGEEGDGAAMAMRVLVRTGEAMGARRLLDIVGAHVDGCLYHGRAGVDFVERLVAGGAGVVVPTTLNVGSLDLLHPELVGLKGEDLRAARVLMDGYLALGCRPTWTCAPYLLAERPAFGDQVAWGESNAVVFANSVLGARTERYGDFLDICAAVTGRAPAVGLHLDGGRQGGMVVDVESVSDLLGLDAVYPLLGHIVGKAAEDRIPVVTGLPPSVSEDQLKALGAAAASSGAVGMFHAVGVTPEAPDPAWVTSRGTSLPSLRVDRWALDRARYELTTAAGGATVDAVSLGAPHYSPGEVRQVLRFLDGRECRLPVYINTSRHTLGELRSGEIDNLAASGVRLVTDTCTYVTPILAPSVRVVMTDSAKWAYYAPANLGVDVVFGSLEACIETAVAGVRVELW